MQFPSPITDATFVRRYKRFFADFELADGSLVTAHCANPGSMKTCLVAGAPAWLSRSENPRRKLPYTWEVVECEGVRVFVNPSRANDVVMSGIRSGIVTELCDYSVVEREVAVSQRSRIDFVLRGPARTCYVEVKNVTMGLEPGRAGFPDSVTARGTKHLRELATLALQSKRAVLFFCVSREDAREVSPADAIDPVYGRALRQAVAAGVQVLAYRCGITRAGVVLQERIPVVLTGVGLS
jgi:sugar fermentation stimulation protein A